MISLTVLLVSPSTAVEPEAFVVVTSRLLLAAELSDCDTLERVPVGDSVELEPVDVFTGPC